jgi:large subunit ribosomal protein L31
MKTGIHPQWYHDAVVTCGCGNTFTTGSTMKTLQVDICNKCHPFFTGEVRFVDRQGRVDRFLQKMQAAQGKVSKKAKKNAKNKQAETTEDPKSYQEILRSQQSQLRKSKTQTETPAAA